MRPFYPLSEIKDLIRKGLWGITITAQNTAFDEMEFDEIDVSECVCDELQESHFYKSMWSKKKPGLGQDVYRIWFRGKNVYLKLQIVKGKAVVISFKKA